MRSTIFTLTLSLAACASPTVEPEPVRILPLGDSLTLGYGSAQDGAGA